MQVAERLLHLLTHWVEHNEAHLNTYREWAARAEGEGLETAAAGLKEAIQSVEAANRSLRRAAQELGDLPSGK